MGRRVPASLVLIALIVGATAEWAPAQPVDCPAVVNALGIDVRGDDSLGNWSTPDQGSCRAATSNGFPIPDPSCTPGAANPTLTVEVLKDPRFRTGCVRDKATRPAEKNKTYAWYGIAHPANNTGAGMVCELDHLVSLELGGADSLDNIWPQCGPADAPLAERFFKQKDTVENYLAWKVKHGMSLAEAQRGIAADWTQYLADARRICPNGHCPK